MKAWIVTYKGDDEAITIFAGPTAAKVRYRAWMYALDGWSTLKIQWIRVRRMSEIDALAEKSKRIECIGWEHGRDVWGCLSKD